MMEAETGAMQLQAKGRQGRRADTRRGSKGMGRTLLRTFREGKALLMP